MDPKFLKIVCIVLIAAVTLVPTVIATISGNPLSDKTSKILFTVGILLLAVFVMIDFKDVSATKQKAKIAACIGMVYVLIMRWK